MLVPKKPISRIYSYLTDFNGTMNPSPTKNHELTTLKGCVDYLGGKNLRISSASIELHGLHGDRVNA